MTNNQIIRNEAAHLSAEQLHEIAAKSHTAAQIAALAAQIVVTDENGAEHPGTIEDAELVLAADELHTFNEWKRLGKQVKKGETALIRCHLWQFTTKPSKAQREAAEAEGKEAAEHPHFYPTKAYLFSCLQVEDSTAAPKGRFQNAADIIAYNRKLAAERKAASVDAFAKIRPISVHAVIIASRRVVIPVVCKRNGPIPIREVRIGQLAEIPPGHCFVVPLLGNTRGKLPLSSGAGGMLLGAHLKQIHFCILRAADVFLFSNVPCFHRQHLLSLTSLLLNKSNPPSARECSRLAPAPA